MKNTIKINGIEMSRKEFNARVWHDEAGNQYICPPHGKKIRAYAVKSHIMLREFICRRDNLQCQICGASADSFWSNTAKDNYVPFHLDHIIPRIMGGSNHPDNLQLLCACCNSRKGASIQREAAK